MPLAHPTIASELGSIHVHRKDPHVIAVQRNLSHVGLNASKPDWTLQDNTLDLRTGSRTGFVGFCDPTYDITVTTHMRVHLKDAAVTAVFDADEVTEVRTATPNGTLIHAEVRMGNAVLLLADPQPGWPPVPGLLQIWVSDVAAVLAAGQERGATTLTPPTPFYGSVQVARMQDPWRNLWWLYEPAPGQPDPRPAWEGGPDTVFRTIDQHMRARAGD